MHQSNPLKRIINNDNDETKIKFKKIVNIIIYPKIKMNKSTSKCFFNKTIIIYKKLLLIIF